MTKPCPRSVKDDDGTPVECGRPKMKGKQRCLWHWLMAQPPGIQTVAARQRLNKAAAANDYVYYSRISEKHWPKGERWCSGCQTYVPKFYTTGSRCKACASGAAHAARVEKVYGITGEQYDALLKLQGGVCFICRRPPGKKRLAVDHDHDTGAVRGLLCASNEFGCNRAILGNIKDMAMARRILLYLTVTPYERLMGTPGLTWDGFISAEAARIQAQADAEPVTEPQGQPPPF